MAASNSPDLHYWFLQTCLVCTRYYRIHPVGPCSATSAEQTTTIGLTQWHTGEPSCAADRPSRAPVKTARGSDSWKCACERRTIYALEATVGTSCALRQRVDPRRRRKSPTQEPLTLWLGPRLASADTSPPHTRTTSELVANAERRSPTCLHRVLCGGGSLVQPWGGVRGVGLCRTGCGRSRSR
jgi:hypothetical protein